MKSSDVIKLYEKYVMNTYLRVPISLTKGKRSYVWDLEQNRYLDFFPGWGVSAIGHCHPKVVSHVKDQVTKIIHVSNNYYNHLQAKLAKMLIRISGIKGKVFFCNSGAEANEAAFKLARAYGKGKRYKIITMENSFHGRTLACISATGQRKYQEGFAPLVPGFISVSFNDLSAVKKAIDEETVAIMLELIQGEGGIYLADKDYVQALRQLCDEKDILLIFDEVQTGFGRTGKWFAFQHYDVMPDIITVAKAIAGGLPMGVMIACNEIAKHFSPGMHASTFGGGPLVAKAALAVIDAIMKEKLLKNAREMGAYLKEKLEELQKKHDLIKEVRGMGLMLGLELKDKGKEVYQLCFERKLLLNLTHDRILRIMPALVVTKREIDKAIEILDDVLSEVAR